MRPRGQGSGKVEAQGINDIAGAPAAAAVIRGPGVAPAARPGIAGAEVFAVAAPGFITVEFHPVDADDVVLADKLVGIGAVGAVARGVVGQPDLAGGGRDIDLDAGFVRPDLGCGHAPVVVDPVGPGGIGGGGNRGIDQVEGELPAGRDPGVYKAADGPSAGEQGGEIADILAEVGAAAEAGDEFEQFNVLHAGNGEHDRASAVPGIAIAALLEGGVDEHAGGDADRSAEGGQIELAADDASSLLAVDSAGVVACGLPEVDGMGVEDPDDGRVLCEQGVCGREEGESGQQAEERQGGEGCVRGWGHLASGEGQGN
ncbi:MAG: hypothetical protein BWY77_00308 [bacterium ADurb.Bin431]|nr:MAG: hypothetical protein BWY77_00308 [bacterium ADurb.Bin431]